MKVTVHSKRRILDGFFKVDEVKLQYEKFDGSMTPVLTRLNFERGDSVAAIILNIDTRKIILVNQFKYPVYEKGPGWITEVVAGMVGPGEQPESAIQREIVEESGYQATRLEHISTFYVSPGGSSERIILFYAEVTDSSRCSTGGGLVSEGEDIRLIEIPLSEAWDAIASQTIKDAKSIVALMWLWAREVSKK
jgi:nudix-type nucleoside diphosphatase (YffH/AdpP family)